MKRLRAAVVGVGYLGRFHAQKYAAHPDVELVAVVDSSTERAQEVGAEVGARAMTSHQALAGQIDIATVAVPTFAHLDVARDLMEAGVHVLVEKPLAASLEDARKLVAIAEARQRVLQVGHLERFNPVAQALAQRVREPLFIECNRISPFRGRGTDVNVVLDLMIHDIDLVLNLVGSELEEIDANGAAVISDTVDIANARLRFASGCVANVTASRVSFKRERRMRVFQKAQYLSVDLDSGSLEVRSLNATAPDAEMPAIHTETLEFSGSDALAAEVAAFVRCVEKGTPPLVGGNDGVRALQAAMEITRQLDAQSLQTESRRQASAQSWIAS